jgi:hypothetical protein
MPEVLCYVKDLTVGKADPGREPARFWFYKLINVVMKKITAVQNNSDT